MVALVALFMVIYCISQKHSKHDRLRSRRAALKGLVHTVEKTEFNTKKNTSMFFRKCNQQQQQRHSKRADKSDLIYMHH